MDMSISTTQPVQLPESLPKSPTTPVAAPTVAVVEDEVRGSRHGRRFVQQGAHHLLRDIRHQMKAEVAELRESGDLEKVDAVKSAYQDFRDGIKSAVEAAGRGHDFDRGAVAEGIGTAMASFTAALRELNGPVEEAAVIPEPGGTRLPELDEALPAGALLDLSV